MNENVLSQGGPWHKLKTVELDLFVYCSEMAPKIVVILQ